MNQVIAINGSPRKNGNTATLLQKALAGAASTGAETTMIHLVDLNYKGCTSCFACKRKRNNHIGSCAMRDDLSPVLKKVMQSNAIFLGSPIYLGDVTALMRGFIERFGFMNTSYDNKSNQNFTGKINGAFFYTMNVPRLASVLFQYVFKFNTAILKKMNGTVKQLISTDTWQFDDYGKYEASNFDVAKKQKARKRIFPKNCEKAYQIGVQLSSGGSLPLSANTTHLPQQIKSK